MATNAMNADDVRIVRPKVSGSVFVASKGTAIPSTVTAEDPTGFTTLGWLSDDGIKMKADRSVTDLKGFGGDVIKTITEAHDLSFTFTPVEVNAEVLKKQFGESNVKTNTDGSVKSFDITGGELDPFAMCIELVCDNGDLLRIGCANCKVTSTGDFALSSKDPMASEWTVKAYPDENGKKAQAYIAKPAAA